MSPEEIVNIQSRYEAITLNFGKQKVKHSRLSSVLMAARII